MRLIDDDALIEKAHGIEDNGDTWSIESADEFEWALDDYAPTIEPTEEFEWCHDCKEYDQEKHCCHRWTKQIRKTVAELEEYNKPKWIPCSERLPEPEEFVLVTTIGMYPWAPNEKKVAISVMYGTEEHYIWSIPQSYVTVIAWMPLPEPYKEGE